MIKLNDVNWGKVGLFLGGMLLTAASSIVNGKIQDDKMKAEIAEQVKEELASRAKES